MDAPLTSLADYPAPEGGQAIFFERDNVKLRLAKWLPTSEAPARGTIVLLHGRTEFIAKYYEVISDLRRRGFAVLTFDWRGQGLSTRELVDWQRGYVRSFHDFLDDFKAIVASEFAADMPKPWGLMSHSMGGPVALRFLQEDDATFQRAVLCAPMFGMQTGLPAPVFNALLLGAMALGRGGKEPFASKPVDPATQRFETNPVTTDRKRFEQAQAFVRAEPRLGVSGISWSWINAAQAFLKELWAPENVARIKTPCLFIQAAEELLVERDAAAHLAELSPQCDALMIEGARHELLMEQDIYRDQFFKAFDDFMAKL